MARMNQITRDKKVCGQLLSNNTQFVDILFSEVKNLRRRSLRE